MQAASKRRITVNILAKSPRAPSVFANKQEASTKDRPHNGEKAMTRPTNDKTTSRRRFLKVAAAGAAATVAAPAVVSAQGPISMRWQSTWPSKDIFHEYAMDYAKKVNDMTGGDLKIEVLP